MSENPLYRLTHDPAGAVREITEWYLGRGGRGEAGLLGDLGGLLADDVLDLALIETLRGSYRLLLTPQPLLPMVRGALGVFVALHAATASTLMPHPEASAIEEARSPFGDRAVRASFSRFYKVGAYYDLGEAQLHRIGTTSLIIQCALSREDSREPEHSIALKCILPRYWNVGAIRRATAEYGRQHAVKDGPVPHIHECTELWIAMDFVDGPTLAEVFADRAVTTDVGTEIEQAAESTTARERALNGQDVEFIRALAVALCRVMGQLHEKGRRHLDLSPSNVIVTDDTDGQFELCLVDLGHNFAITDRAGTSTAFRTAALYIADELVIDPSIDDVRCDLYSLGIVLLEAAAKRRIEQQSVSIELDRLWQGEEPWEGAPGLGRIIDELVDRDPENRLVMMPESGWVLGNGPYEYLERLILQETEVLDLYYDRNEEGGFGRLRGWSLFRVWKNTQIAAMNDAARRLRHRADDSYDDFPALTRWAFASLACWTFVLSVFVLLTLADLGWTSDAESVQQYKELVGAPFEVGKFWENLPGRLVALSFCLTAVTYYINNYSLLSPKRLHSRLGLASEWVMRSTAVLLTLPILWAMVWQPADWAICSGIGTSLVVLNNYLTLAIARRAAGLGRFSVRGVADGLFIDKVYKEWWRLMAYYSLSMLVIGVLLELGWARDARVFAGLVVFINLQKMYRLNCVETAPQVRGALGRAILTLRRSQTLDDRSAPIGEDGKDLTLALSVAGPT